MSHSASSLAEKAIHESKLASSTVEHLQNHFHQATQAKDVRAAGWHGSDDIQTLIGLEGNFLWAEDPFKVSNIYFKFDPDKVGNQGTYKITSLQSAMEQGIFYSVPNNPAIGWAFVSLVPQASSARPFIISGMMTDNEWKASIILLNKVGDSGPLLPPFSAIRTG